LNRQILDDLSKEVDNGFAQRTRRAADRLNDLDKKIDGRLSDQLDKLRNVSALISKREDVFHHRHRLRLRTVEMNTNLPNTVWH